MAKKTSSAKKRATLRVLIVEARFYEPISDALLAGATRVLDEAGATYDRIAVPGALEVPAAIAMAVDAAQRKRAPYDGVVALGCVIQGETYHFELVSNESARGLMDLSVSRQLAIGNGILTVDNEAQARARSTDDGPNKGGAARLAAVQALYQMDLAGTGLNEILAEFESHWLGREVEGAQYLPAEAAFFRDIVSGVVREQRKLDPIIDEALAKSWPLKRIEAVLRAVLRAGCYELDHRRDVPARVVVSEYADVAAAFVEREETGMINAVLDQLARKMRAAEFAG